MKLFATRLTGRITFNIFPANLWFACALCTTVATGVFSQTARAKETSPPARNIVLSVTMDKASIPSSIMIFDHLFAGQTSDSIINSASLNLNGANSLTCLSRTDTTRGACPVNPYWGNGVTAPLTGGNLVLRFTQQGTGKTVDLTLDGVKTRPPYAPVSPWNAAGTNGGAVTMTLGIPATELMKLSPGSQPWRANLSMNITRWTYECGGPNRWDPSVGCPGTPLVPWSADITLKITDIGTQQIYFSQYGAVSPVVDLGLKMNGFGSSSATASAVKNIDMCLYDGSNSSSSQISLLFRDEGKGATGRSDGNFSVYSESGGTDTANRLDYSVSVVNPKTGAAQSVVNGQELVWTGVSADNGAIKTRSVSLPGISGLVRCVPAPLTLTVPQFKLSSKSRGRYTGKLYIVYTPTTQSWTDTINH